MRKRIAIAISVLALSVLVTLSVLFAVRQNPAARTPLAAAAVPVASTAASTPTTTERQPSLPAQETDSLRGLRVFREQGCERCHSVRGVGSPRVPLDGVGSQRDLGELLAWTVGALAVQDSLAPSAVRAKRRYEQIPREEMRVLLAYLAALKES